NGHFKESAGSYAGMFIKDADPVIVKDLKIAGKLFKKELYEHNYPFCWRCSSPLIYISMDSWYIRTTQFKEQLLDNSNAVNWCPDEIGTGRMADWLQNNVDWAISRQRFWGTPLPIWVCDSETCDKKRAVGSIEQLRKEGIDVPDELDLHKPMMDRVQLRCECGSTMTRVPEVIDVWFDSGAMPFAQWHYPFENKEEFEKKHPADFISEAIDQTRGWFYSLLAISTMLFDKAPYKNVVVLEFILDKEGKKMSKSKGNVVDPFTTVDKFGADPLRWYMVSTSNPWLPTRFDLDGLAEVVRKYFDTLRNTYSFFALYANIDRVTDRANTASLSIDAYLESKAGPSDRFDRWIESKYNSLVRDVTAGFEKYDITKPVRAIQSFVIDELSNWYVRNNRRRFWAKGDDPSKMRAYLTLYRIIIGLCRLTAPVAPFVSEMIYRELTGDNQSRNTLPLSVHLTEFPRADESVIDNDLEQAMTLAEQVVSLGRAARSRHRLKVRQPLSRLMVALPDGIRFESLSELLSVIREELNVKKVAASGKLNQYLSFAVKLNFKTAGPKLGGNVKAVAAALAQMDSSAIQVCQSSGKWEIAADGKSFELSGEDVDVSRIENDGYAVESTGAVTIVLVTSLTNELVDEGFAREIVNKIQNMRKTSGFDVTDTITVRVATSKRLQSAATRYDEFIRRETLATSIEFIDISSLPEATEWNINGEKTAIALSRVTPRVEA
ncbi:MAG: class I tRNA ligase family protein, partial [Candidatus Zixiibacteriota bacterium]